DGRRDLQPVTVMIFDLDHFKAINDRFGHPVGDMALRVFSQVVTKAIRTNDLFGRIGGEEFAAVLIGARAETGHRIADRVRADFLSAVKVDGKIVPATVSVGVADATPEMHVALD